jgi:pimeloyl-ACP methyl ester carboxylesterase
VSRGKVLRRLLIAAGGAATLFLLAVWLGGTLLLHRKDRSEIPSPGRGQEEVRFIASDGVILKGWWWPGRDPERALLLLHGLWADRLQMFPRARWLHDSGYSVFLFDFRGCGESGGAVTFGFRERLDVEAALEFLQREKKVAHTVIIGQSMGAAAAIMGVDGWREGVKGAVLESPFDRFSDAVRVRVRGVAGWMEPVVSPLLLAQIRPRLGFPPADLAPVEAIHRARCPVLLGFGGKDPYVTESELGEFFRAAPYPATLWVLQKAGHTDLFRFDPNAYRAKVGDFVASTLGSPDKGCKG